MAKNLLKKGYPLVVFDVSKDSVQSLKEAGKFFKWHTIFKKLTLKAPVTTIVVCFVTCL